MDTGRLKRVVLYGILILLAGSIYGMIVSVTGVGLPCMFHTITGLQCPGCGVTHMCTALMKLDLHHAIQANPVIFALLPLWIVSFIKNIILYVRTGSYQLNRIENILLYASIVLLLAYGVIRNI